MSQIPLTFLTRPINSVVVGRSGDDGVISMPFDISLGGWAQREMIKAKEGAA
jgi:hypothetical protein